MAIVFIILLKNLQIAVFHIINEIKEKKPTPYYKKFEFQNNYFNPIHEPFLFNRVIMV